MSVLEVATVRVGVAGWGGVGVPEWESFRAPSGLASPCYKSSQGLLEANTCKYHLAASRRELDLTCLATS